MKRGKSCRKIMIKDNLSVKLVTRSVAAALVLIITLTGASGAAETSDAAISQQSAAQTSAVAVTTEAADETVAYSVATFKASQDLTTSSVTSNTSKTEAVTAASSKPAATTVKKSAATSAKNNQAVEKSSAVTSKAAVTQLLPEKTTAVTTTTKSAQFAASNTVTAPVSAGASVELAKPVILAEQTYDSDSTHPWNHQTNQITVRWKAVSGAKKYMVYIYGGQYTKWTEIATTSDLKYTALSLKRQTAYSFMIKAVGDDGKFSQISEPVTIRTARMDYSAAGWQAMCRIVYHEVGGAAGSLWDKPIVYVADCVTNQYVCAKYTKQGVWPKYYSRYSNIESVIYTSGGFASSAMLSARGANYSNVSQRVKLAVWGATYGVTYYKNIANDYNIFFWSSTSYAVSSPKMGYSFKTPWGSYVNIWRQYWG